MYEFVPRSCDTQSSSILLLSRCKWNAMIDHTRWVKDHLFPLLIKLPFSLRLPVDKQSDFGKDPFIYGIDYLELELEQSLAGSQMVVKQWIIWERKYSKQRWKLSAILTTVIIHHFLIFTSLSRVKLFTVTTYQSSTYITWLQQLSRHDFLYLDVGWTGALPVSRYSPEFIKMPVQKATLENFPYCILKCDLLTT